MRYLIRFLVLLVLVIILHAPAYATQNPVYPFGRVTVSVPASQYINVFASGAPVKVYKQVGGPSGNQAAKYTLETNGTVTNGEVVFGPYTNATNIRIEAGADLAFYSVGALAASLSILKHTPRPAYTQFTPATANTTATLLTSDLMKGLITSTQATGATITLTLPTGALADAAAGLEINEGFEWSIINLSAAAADTVTLAAGSGHTIVGTATVPSAHSSTGGLYGNAGRFLTRKTADDTFVTYRIR